MDAAAVLHGYERQEAQQLLGPARGLLAGEGRGGEPVERAARRGARGGEALAADERGVAQLGVSGRGACGRRGAAILP